MGLIQSESLCPQCGRTMLNDFNSKRCVTDSYCLSCGRNEKWSLKKKQRIKHVIRKGYGYVCIVSFNNGVTGTSLHKPIRKKNLQSFISLLNSKGIDKDNSYLSKWDAKSKTVIALYGNLPE